MIAHISPEAPSGVIPSIFVELLSPFCLIESKRTIQDGFEIGMGLFDD